MPSEPAAPQRHLDHVARCLQTPRSTCAAGRDDHAAAGSRCTSPSAASRATGCAGDSTRVRDGRWCAHVRTQRGPLAQCKTGPRARARARARPNARAPHGAHHARDHPRECDLAVGISQRTLCQRGHHRRHRQSRGPRSLLRSPTGSPAPRPCRALSRVRLPRREILVIATPTCSCCVLRAGASSGWGTPIKCEAGARKCRPVAAVVLAAMAELSRGRRIRGCQY